MPWIWEIVRGGFVPNWWAREACVRIAVSVSEVGVETSLGWSDWGSWFWFGVLVGEGEGAMSPGATGFVSFDWGFGWVGDVQINFLGRLWSWASWDIVLVWGIGLVVVVVVVVEEYARRGWRGTSDSDAMRRVQCTRASIKRFSIVEVG